MNFSEFHIFSISTKTNSNNLANANFIFNILWQTSTAIPIPGPDIQE